MVTYNRVSYIERDATLFINKNISVFHEKMNTSKEIKKENVDDFIDDNTLKFDVKYNDKYYKYNSDTKEITFVDHIIMVGDFIVNDKPPIIDWQLEDETKIISNLKCYKATGIFRGRKWIAWYTSEIPFSVGPWKFNGLPGLIIEAYSQDKRYSFVLRNIKFNEELNIIIPKVDKTVTIKEFIQLKEEFHQNVISRVSERTDGDLSSTKFSKSVLLEPKYEWEE